MIAPVLRALAGALPLALAACAASAPPVPCPRPAIVDGAQTVEGRNGPAPSDVRFRATMTGFGGGCRYEGGDVILAYALDVALVPGPAAVQESTPVVLPWFVAVADPSGTIVDKQLFELRSEAPAPGRPRLVVERLEQRIRGVSPAEGPSWRIYFGFELDPEEARARLRARAR